MDKQIEHIDCACVIHGNAYAWLYVERLYNMLRRYLTPAVRLHVYTEAHRPVPEYFIKHSLSDLPTNSPIRGWWYKLQLFNPAHHSGPLLYFDLDTVIVDNIDWMWQQNTRYFWAVRDFRYIWRPTSTGINSSVMWWDTNNWSHIWHTFSTQDLNRTVLRYRGDQDFLNDIVAPEQRRFFDTEFMKSWRWQCLDGGYDFDKRRHKKPGTGTKIDHPASVLIFHGHPKPHEIQDPVIVEHWK